MSKSWEEVQAVLDDPYVPADTKEALLTAYVVETGDDAPDEVNDYLDGTKAHYNLDGDLFPAMYQSTDQLYQQAQDERDEAGYSAQLTDEDVETGRTDLEGMQAPHMDSPTTGPQKSDEIFEAARPALRVFEDFLPINDKVPADCLGRYRKLNFENDIKKRFDEQLGISFKNFLDDAKRIKDAHTELSDVNTSTESQLNTLYREWTGPAANSSYRYYTEELTPNVTDLLDYLSFAPELINTTVRNIFTSCKTKANEVIERYQSVRGTVGSATPHIAEQVVKLANGDFSSQDEVLEVAAWVDSTTGANLESTLRSDDCDLNEENKEYTIRECKKWIRDSFNTDLHDNLYANFKQACDDAVEAVNLHYQALNDYLKEYENKFSQSQPPPAQQQPPPTGDNGNGNGNGDTGTGGGGTGTGGGGGTGTGGGSGGTGTGGGGGGGMPEVQTPPPTDPAKDPNAPGTTDPSGQDTPGEETQPDQTNPQTPGQDQQETVTIKDGDKEIAVTSPDGQGMVKVTVDDGSGQPKTYTLDFGAADPTTGAAAGTPGQSGTPGTANTPGQPGTPGQESVAQGEYGPNGAPPAAPGTDAPIEPGPDGKCVITDGDMTITAERPEGQPDTVVVTVDDGSGNPTTYNLDYSEANTQPATDQPQGVTGAPYQVSGDLAEPMPAQVPADQVTTMPAPGEGPQPMPADVSTQPAYGEMPAQLQADQVTTMPAPGEGPQPMPADVSTQPAYGEMPAQLQSEQVSTQMPAQQQPAFATTAAAFDDPGAAAGNSGPGQAGSFGAPDQSPSPYMSHTPGEASLPSAPDAPADQSGGQQAHPGMAGGGMPMMGGAPGGGGGDSERAATQWRTTGDLFDEPLDQQRMRSAFNGEGS